MTDTKFLANQNKKYFSIIENKDGSITINHKTYKNGLIGKRVSGIKKALIRCVTLVDFNEYEISDGEEVMDDYSDTGIIIGELNYLDHLVAVRCDIGPYGGALEYDFSGGSNTLGWLYVKDLTIGGVINHLKFFIHRLLATSGLEVLR